MEKYEVDHLKNIAEIFSKVINSKSNILCLVLINKDMFKEYYKDSDSFSILSQAPNYSIYHKILHKAFDECGYWEYGFRFTDKNKLKEHLRLVKLKIIFLTDGINY